MYFYDEPLYEPTPADEGWYHETQLPDLELTREHLEGCLESLYEHGDVQQLEDCLSHLCALYDVHYKVTQLKVASV